MVFKQALATVQEFTAYVIATVYKQNHIADYTSFSSMCEDAMLYLYNAANHRNCDFDIINSILETKYSLKIVDRDLIKVEKIQQD